MIDQLAWAASPATAFGGALAFLVFLTFVLRWRHKKLVSEKSLPEPEGSWPIIGHLRLLTEAKDVPHVTFSNLADKYGSIFKVRFGVRDVVVVNSWEVAKECLSTKDKSFLTRPTTYAFELLGYSSAMFGLSPYGTYWRETRKIATLQLLSNQRMEILKPVRVSQFQNAIKSLYNRWESGQATTNMNTNYKLAIDLKEWLFDLFLNAIIQIIAGKSLSEIEGESPEKFVELVKEFLHVGATLTVGDALPFLKFMDIGGHGKAIKDVSDKVDRYTSLLLENHKRERAQGKVKKQEDRDFMDIMLDYIDNNPEIENLGYDKDTIIKATCLSLILAGGDTSPVAMSWGFSLLLNHPEILKKAQNELDTLVGRERQVTASDIPNLVYIQAIIKEHFRLCPTVALSVPRQAMDNVHLAGYRIKSGSWLYVNIYKIQRDPRVWDNPDEFRPERFLEEPHKNVDFKGQNFEFIPFSSGRRMCPGMPYAMQGVSFLLATMLHSFDLSRPSDELIDMTPQKGISNAKLTPVDALLTPRLPPHLYSTQ